MERQGGLKRGEAREESERSEANLKEPLKSNELGVFPQANRNHS